MLHGRLLTRNHASQIRGSNKRGLGVQSGALHLRSAELMPWSGRRRPVIVRTSPCACAALLAEAMNSLTCSSHLALLAACARRRISSSSSSKMRL